MDEKGSNFAQAEQFTSEGPVTSVNLIAPNAEVTATRRLKGGQELTAEDMRPIESGEEQAFGTGAESPKPTFWKFLKENRSNLEAKATNASVSSASRSGHMVAEIGRHGVTVNAIAPGFFATELNQALLADKEFTAWVERRTPAGRWAKPEELGGAVIFLASDAASYVNRHVLD